jgi:outer membrane protein assembly factor BamA
MSDGTVQLQVFVKEPPPRHLEYGLGKSLYTGGWEGELDFEHQNLFGGGETVGLMVRRGTKDAAPSVRLRYSDENFGLEGGHDFEVFSEFVGDDVAGPGEDDVQVKYDYENDSLLDRKGATFRVKNPIDPKMIRNSVASASLERMSTRTGLHENIGSATLTIGPFRKMLPMDARSSISTSVTGGTRLGDKEPSEESSRLNIQFLPYSSVSATARQVLPLSKPQEGRKPFTLALQHTIATSTLNLPRHEAKAMGISAQIRGASPDGSASSTVKGTAEVRVPLDVARVGEGAVVLFGDWFYVQKDHQSPFYAKSSVGIGFRKNFQGLPLKYDVCYSSEGKIKTMFGLGVDFDA